MGQLASAGASKPYLGRLGSGALDRYMNMDGFAVLPCPEKDDVRPESEKARHRLVRLRRQNAG